VSAIDELVTELSRLPTIGRKSAMRLTYHLLKQSPDQARRLADALGTLHERVRELLPSKGCPGCMVAG
jgi:recombination protein RecR